MKLKKMLAILLACMTMTCTLAACGDDDDDDKDKKRTKVSDTDDDDDGDDGEEETTKRNRKSSSEDSDEESSSKKGKDDDDDDDLDYVAYNLSKAINTALMDLDVDGYTVYETVFCSSAFDTLCFDEDDEDIDFDDFYDMVEKYFDDLDDYEFIAVIDWNECEALFVSKSASSKNMGTYGDTDYFDGDNLNEIYDYCYDAYEEYQNYESDSYYDSIQYNVYWAAYFAVRDLYYDDLDCDDALICSDSKKNIYDGKFDIDKFNENFADELDYYDIDNIDDYKYIIVVLEQDVEFVAVAKDFDTTDVGIFSYDDYEETLEGMSLNEIYSYFE